MMSLMGGTKLRQPVKCVTEQPIKVLLMLLFVIFSFAALRNLNR